MAQKDNIFIFRDENRLVVQFPSQLDNINRVEEETRRFLDKNGLAAEIFPVCLTMREGLLNAVKHGNRFDPGKTVKYALTFSDDILTMEVEDQGDGFDWQSIQHIHPSEKSEHGRGIFIMKRYFSGFNYNGKGNKLTLTKFSPVNRGKDNTYTSHLEALAQAILQAPDRIGKTSEAELFQLIEDLYVRNNRLALQNAELRRAQSWVGGQGQDKTVDDGLGARYRVLFEHNPTGTITVDQQGRITEYSLAKSVAGGRLPEIGSVMYRDYAASHIIDMHAELMASIQSGVPREFPEQPYEDKIYHIRLSPFPGGAVITSLEITSLKHAEMKFLRLLSALEETIEEIVVFNQRGMVEYVNRAFLNRSGLDREMMIGLPYHDEKMTSIGDLFTEKMRQVMTEGAPWSGRLSRNEEDGRRGIQFISPVKDEIGAIIGFVSVASTVVDNDKTAS